MFIFLSFSLCFYSQENLAYCERQISFCLSWKWIWEKRIRFPLSGKDSAVKTRTIWVQRAQRRTRVLLRARKKPKGRGSFHGIVYVWNFFEIISTYTNCKEPASFVCRNNHYKFGARLYLAVGLSRTGIWHANCRLEKDNSKTKENRDSWAQRWPRLLLILLPGLSGLWQSLASKLCCLSSPKSLSNSSRTKISKTKLAHFILLPAWSFWECRNKQNNTQK